MKNELWEEATVSEAIRDLIHRQNYEEYVFQIISNSKRIFKNCHFERVNEQSHGECDFIDVNSEDKKKYEVKLLFDKETGGKIGERKNNLTLWIERLLEQRNEYGKLLMQGVCDVSSTKLYQIAKGRLSAVKSDETAILFTIFPIVEDSRNDVYTQFGVDFVQAIYKQLDKDKLTEGREKFFIYPAMEDDLYCIRDRNYHREYVPAPKLNDIVSYKVYPL